MDTDFLNRIEVKIWRKRNLDLDMFLFELMRHRDFPFTVFQPNPRHNQAKVAIFIKVLRQTEILKSVFTCLCLLDQIEEATEGAVSDFHRLLRNVGVESLIVLINLYSVVVRFVAEKLSLGKEVLTNRIQCHIVKILRQSSEQKQCGKLRFAQAA